MAILLLAKHDNATLSDQTAKTLTAATQIGGDVTEQARPSYSAGSASAKIFRGPEAGGT